MDRPSWSREESPPCNWLSEKEFYWGKGRGPGKGVEAEKEGGQRRTERVRKEEGRKRLAGRKRK